MLQTVICTHCVELNLSNLDTIYLYFAVILYAIVIYIVFSRIYLFQWLLKWRVWELISSVVCC